MLLFGKALEIEAAEAYLGAPPSLVDPPPAPPPATDDVHFADARDASAATPGTQAS